MSNLPNFYPQFFDGNGDPLSGGKIYFYRAGTGTPLDTYPTLADALAGTNANSNPVILDANGHPSSDIWGTDDDYDMVLKTSADVTVYSQEDVNFSQLLSSGLALRIAQIATNPLDYGAVGDGAADERAEVQEALSAAGSGVLNLLGQIYRCDSSLVMSLSTNSGLTIENGILDFTNDSSGGFYIFGSGNLATSVLLSADASAGDETISLDSSSGISSGDRIFLSSDAVFGGGSDRNGEVVRVKSISGDDVTVDEPLLYGYTQANNAYIRRIIPLKNITLKNLEIRCSPSASGAGRAIDLNLCENVFIENVRVVTPKGVGIDISDSIGSVIYQSEVFGSLVTGIGFRVTGFSRNVDIFQSRAYGLATGFDVGEVGAFDGVCRMTNMREVGAYGCTTGANIRVNSEYTVLNGEVTYPSGGTPYSDSGTATRVQGFVDISSGDFDGFNAQGGGSGSGIDATGGSSGPGVTATAGGGNADGVNSTGSGTGDGIDATGGSSGPGGRFTAGGGDTHGAIATGSGAGAGVSAAGGADGPAIFMAGSDEPNLLAGGLWFDSTTRRLRLSDGAIWAKIPMQVFALDAAGDSLTSAAYATLQLSAADISYEVPAGRLNQVGATIRIRGELNTAAYAAGSVTYLRLMFGGAQAVLVINNKDPLGQNTWAFDIMGTVRATGASGSIRWSAKATTYANVVSASSATQTIDLTNAQSFTMEHHYATASQTVQLSQLIIDLA